MSVAKQASLPAAAPATAGALVDALWRRGLERIVYGVAGLALFILVAPGLCLWLGSARYAA